MDSLEFKDINEDDLDAVLEIYNYYIENTTATFHSEKLKKKDLNKFIFINHEKYKSYLILNDEKKICGYCLLTQYKKRQAYDRTAEVTVYLKPGFTGKGYGKKAVQYLEKTADNAGIKVLIAVITFDNKPSIKLFENAGYEKSAHFKQIGEKFGRVLDVVCYQKIL